MERYALIGFNGNANINKTIRVEHPMNQNDSKKVANMNYTW